MLVSGDARRARMNVPARPRPLTSNARGLSAIESLPVASYIPHYSNKRRSVTPDPFSLRELGGVWARDYPPPFLHTASDQKLEAGTAWERG